MAEKGVKVPRFEDEENPLRTGKVKANSETKPADEKVNPPVYVRPVKKESFFEKLKQQLTGKKADSGKIDNEKADGGKSDNGKPDEKDFPENKTEEHQGQNFSANLSENKKPQNESLYSKLKDLLVINSKKRSELERTSTGIPGLDDMIQGGFIKKSINIIAGSPGAGKSIFAIQFIIDGIKNHDENGIYISFEEKKESFYKYMLQFGWDLEAYERQGKFAYIRYSPEQVDQLLEEGGGIVENISQKINAKRIAIDSITAFTLLHRNELATRESLLKLFDLINKWGCTTIATAEQESDPEKHKPSVIEFEADGVILLYNFRKKDIRQRVAEILKMRGTKFTQKIFPIKITKEGIVFYPDETAF
ncbi:MAG: ATPase domain-containing protein [Nanoarchaeota archaeon]|nr:ATPase domain-containing protein [Nanoarchaeota archaeon]